MSDKSEISILDSACRSVAEAVDAQRLQRRLRGLAEFGAIDTGGISREALTRQELVGRRWLVQDFASRSGYVVGIDEAANVVIRRLGQSVDAEPVMTGSHADTQPVGGWLDGAFGVVAGLEVFEALDALNISTHRSLDVVMWTNEEGSRFSPGLMGSVSYTSPERLQAFLSVSDREGITFREARDAAVSDFTEYAHQQGWTLMGRTLGMPVHAYIESHIEQGPVLEDERLQVGCVTGIQGVRWFQIMVSGRSAHAGTTPLLNRDDAQVKAIELAHTLINYSKNVDDDRLRLTLGRWHCEPGSINTIADRVTFTVDVRHPDAQALDQVQRIIESALPSGARMDVLQSKSTVQFDSHLVEMINHICESLAIEHRPMLSGAFHDAMPMAEFCPTAMIFAPSIKGVSHHPSEDTNLEDLTASTKVLAWSLLQLAQLHFDSTTR